MSPGSTTRAGGRSPSTPAATSARAAPSSRTGTGGCGGHADRRPRAAGQRRLPQSADPEPAPDLALQHRQPVRAVLVPGGRRRRRGDGRARLRRRRAVDHAHLADPEGRALSELEDGQAARRLGAPLPAHARPGLRRRRDADAAPLRRRARPPDRGERHRAARPRALLVGHPRRRCSGCTRRRPSGRACGRWAASGRRRANAALARRCAALAKRLEAGLRRAVASSQRRLGDGSLFIPARLLDGEPAVRLADAGAARQLLEPRHAVRARLGDLRAGEPGGGRACSGTCSATGRGCSASSARAPTRSTRSRSSRSPGTDQVYGINVARFLADGDAADQLVLSLYGSLAVAMTPNTFVSGEAASVAPLARQPLPLDVPASERREQRGVPADAAIAARARDAVTPRERRPASSSRSRRRGRGCGRGADRRPPGADELRAGLVLARRAQRHDLARPSSRRRGPLRRR